MGTGFVRWVILRFIFMQKSKSKLSRELSDLVVYCKSVHFHGFEHARLHGKCYEMSSFSESKAKRLTKEAGTMNTRRTLEKSREIWNGLSGRHISKIICLFYDYIMLCMHQNSVSFYTILL